MKIEIELTKEEWEPLAKMAKMAGTSVARIAEAILQGQAQSGFLDNEGDLNWLSVVEYVSEAEGWNQNLRDIKLFTEAIREHGKLTSFAARKRANFGQLNSLAAFVAWKRDGVLPN